MKLRSAQVLAIAAFCVGLAASASAVEDASRGVLRGVLRGVVVEEVGTGSVLAGVGLQPGDRLLGWESAGIQEEIRTTFDWLGVRTEQAPRGTVRLRGERAGAAVVFDVPPGSWDARVRPGMSADLLQAYAAGRQRIAAGDLAGGIALWDPIVRSGDLLGCWILLEAGEAWARGGQGEKALGALQAALAEARDAQARVAVLTALGNRYELANEMARAEESFRAALEAGEAAWGDSLQVARTASRLGNILRLRNRLDEAAQIQSRALEIQQRLAPDSLEMADTLVSLVGLAWARGDLDTMTAHARRALAIQERWSPDSLAVSRILNSLAIVAIERGLHEEAAAALQRALAIQRERSPGILYEATLLSNLGLQARMRGDLGTAEELFARALAIAERLAPASLNLPPILNNLAAIARDRGELAEAEKLFRRAQEIWGKAAPEGLGVAGGYDSLGLVARLRGDLDEAWKLHGRALEIHQRLAPDGIDAATGYRNLGTVAEARGDLNLALDLHQRSHALFERLAPGTTAEALELHQLGRMHRLLGHPGLAAQFLARAVDALESQVGRLGGSQDLQAAFRASHEDIYRDAIEVELERERAAEAFHLLERSRARSFLALLAERDLAFSGELPAGLERSRRDNATGYDQAQRKLSRWTPAAGEAAREELVRELSRLRQERGQIAAEIRQASPRLAALRQPRPLDLEAARKVLDPGTLALAYSVGKDRTVLFAVTREGGLKVEVLPLGEERLRRDVESLLERVRKPGPADAPAGLARSLYGALIGPVAALVESSERVLILPDGPLHRLPFGALMRDTGQFLTEWKPLHTALSLTVYETLRASGPAAGSTAGGLVAFGDPRYPKRPAPGQATRGGLEPEPGLRRLHWAALPYTRREVERIAEVYPGARLYLGEEATEERAKSLERGARILHFATHGYADDRTPLDSALVLTIPEELPAGRDNGLLQVWEIFESVRLDADLVVLSSCESALGRELSGEGLIGLTRAFQYAGARSVVASLWSVADHVTAELMARFHGHLAAGLAKDEALRAAQMELIRGPLRITTPKGQTLETNASSPFFWAAFQLFGDWR